MRNQDGTYRAVNRKLLKGEGDRRLLWHGAIRGRTKPLDWFSHEEGRAGSIRSEAEPERSSDPSRRCLSVSAAQGPTKGYTLIEVMLVVAIIGIMVGIGPRIMIQFQRFLKLTDARDAIQKDARTGLDTINRTLRQGKSASIVIDQASGQPPYSRVTFTTISGTSVRVYQSNKYLYMTRGNTTSVLSRDLRYIAFTFPRSDDPTIVSVSITMERASYEGGTKALELSIEKVRVMN